MNLLSEKSKTSWGEAGLFPLSNFIRNNQVPRRFVQAVFLIIASYFAWLHAVLGGGPGGAPAIDALCPFGGLASLYKFLAYGGFIQRTNYSNLVLLIGVVLTALLLGRTFCGWVCPLGTMQEWLNRFSNSFVGVKLSVPAFLDSYLRNIKYFVLFLILGLTWYTGTLVFRPIDPWVGYNELYAGWNTALNEAPVAVWVFIIIISLSLFIDRFWCKYLCPLGAFLAIIGKFGLFRVNREEKYCTACGICEDSCTMQVFSSSSANPSIECIGCGECINSCPEENALSFKIAGLNVKPLIAGLLAVAIFLGSYGVAKSAGIWVTKGGGGHIVVPGENQYDGQYDGQHNGQGQNRAKGGGQGGGYGKGN